MAYFSSKMWKLNLSTLIYLSATLFVALTLDIVEGFKPLQTNKMKCAGFIVSSKQNLHNNRFSKLSNTPPYSFSRKLRNTRLKIACTEPYIIGGMLGSLNQFFKSAPIISSFLTCGLKASVADIIAQKREFNAENRKTQSDEKKFKLTSMSFPRNLSFVLYGGLYLGIGQHFMYNHIFPILFGTSKSFKVVLSKVVFDMCFISTTLSLPLAYITKALIHRSTIKEGLKQYVDDCVNHGLWLKNFSVWAPVQCLTFGVIPEHLRVFFIALVSFFWLIILSSICAKDNRGH